MIQMNDNQLFYSLITRPSLPVFHCCMQRRFSVCTIEMLHGNGCGDTATQFLLQLFRSMSWMLLQGSQPVWYCLNIQHAVYNAPLNLTAGLNFVESILAICDIGFDDGGQYTCNASAQGVSSNSTTTITIQQRMYSVFVCACVTPA